MCKSHLDLRGTAVQYLYMKVFHFEAPKLTKCNGSTNSDDTYGSDNDASLSLYSLFTKIYYKKKAN